MLAIDILKPLHIALVVISLSGFALRAFWMINGSSWLSRRPTRILPHIVDTLLLISGIALAWVSGWSPLTHGWLAAKLLALIGYIVFGARALRHRSLPALTAAAVLAAYMLYTAISKQGLPFS